MPVSRRPVIHAAAIAAMLAMSVEHVAAFEPAKPSQIVTGIAVNFGGVTSPPCPGIPNSAIVDRVANPDGTAGTFAIPPKSVLVVTSFDYSLSATPSRYELATIAAIDPSSLPAGAVPNVAFGGGLADAAGRVMGTVAIPGGFVVKPPAILCVQGGSALTSALFAVHGFFAKDK